MDERHKIRGPYSSLPPWRLKYQRLKKFRHSRRKLETAEILGGRGEGLKVQKVGLQTYYPQKSNVGRKTEKSANACQQADTKKPVRFQERNRTTMTRKQTKKAVFISLILHLSCYKRGGPSAASSSSSDDMNVSIAAAFATAAYCIC